MPGAPVWQSRRGVRPLCPARQQQALKSAAQNLVQNWIHALIEYAKIRPRLPPSTPTHSSYENEP